MDKSLTNKYYIYLYQGQEPIPWTPSNTEPTVDVDFDFTYFGKVFEALEDKQLMQEKHSSALNWWNTKCSETAVGSYIAEQLNLL